MVVFWQKQFFFLSLGKKQFYLDCTLLYRLHSNKNYVVRIFVDYYVLFFFPQKLDIISLI